MSEFTNRHTGFRCALNLFSRFFLVTVAIVCGSISVQAANKSNAGSIDAAKVAHATQWYESNVIEIKFTDSTRVRLRGGNPEDLNRAATVGVDIDQILKQFPASTWQRSHTVAEKTLDDMRKNGRAKNGRPLTDMNLYYRLQLPLNLPAIEAKHILEQFDSVQGAYLVPKPSVLPVPPDYENPATSPNQGYLDNAPNGVGSRSLWASGWDGSGVQVCDVEYSVNFNHQDLPSITQLSGPINDPFNDTNHGTAVFGQMVGLNNGSGVKGIAYNMSGRYFAAALTTTGGFDVGRAILECAAAMEPGDIILIEQQTSGPLGCGANQVGCVPVEWVKSTYDAIVTAVANNIIVVEASGNGAQNLDAAIYSTGNNNHWPFLLENDSGAIIVTGGSSTAPHGALSFSNSGSTVDLQAWGQNIVTTGYGNLYNSEGVNLWYTGSFGGSSGASPIVVGVVAQIQDGYRGLIGTYLPPATMRSLLRQTGTAGAGTLANVPMPNAFAAGLALNSTIYVDPGAGGTRDGTTWANAFRELQSALNVAVAGNTIALAAGTHYPDFDPNTGLVTSDPNDSFQLINGVSLLGGYPGGGGVRDPEANQTILTGNIADTKSYHVITGSNTDASAVLDGVTVENGNALAGVSNGAGGGVIILNGSPTLRNLVVRSNAAVNGGGIYVQSGNPTLIDVEFFDNSAGLGGGLFSNISGTQLRDVTFRNNTASNEGGGLFNSGAGTGSIFGARFHNNTAFRGGGFSIQSNATLDVENAVFTGNTATDIGGGVLNFNGILTLNNVTMAGNSAANAGDGMYLFTPTTINNSIIYGNETSQIAGVAVTVSDSIVQGGYAGSNVLNADPLFRDLAGVDNTIGTLDDDVRLAEITSPAQNSANVAINNDCTIADISGNPRVGDCDMGAHEYRGTLGSLWNNGEVDSEFFSQSYDDRPNGAANVRQSADDFVIAPNQACDVTAVNAVLQDPTTTIEAVAELFTDSGGLPATNPFATFSTGAAPGQSLGSQNGARLWEYRFEFPAQRLSAGTYWVSVYGTREDSDTNVVYWPSANEGVVQSNPSHFREVGFGWVDGGLFGGDISRDLAMEIDAVCGCGTDLGCDDGNPGTLDVCDNLVCNNFPRPPNDDYDQAILLGTTGSQSGTLEYGSIDGENSEGATPEPDVWYRFVSPTDGTLVINTCGSQIGFITDTTLSIHTNDGGPGTVANQIEVNDDFASGSDPTACPSGSLDSAMAVVLQAGDDSLIRVSRYDAFAGTQFLLNHTFNAADSDSDGVSDLNDNCTLIANPNQRDSNADGYGNACDPDTNNNGTVEFGDISAWVPFFNQECTSTAERQDNDFNGDGFCNFGDFSLFPGFFQQPPGPGAIDN